MDSAYLKIERAKSHFEELSQLLKENQPYKYCLETNFKTGDRATFAKKDEKVCDNAAIVIGDIIHNLRSSLDHAYWNCTEQFAKSEGERRHIQFPISKNKDDFEEQVLKGIPSRVSHTFCDSLRTLEPYRENGNKYLCSIHDLDITDKHKLLIPTGNYTKLSSELVQKLVPDFPSGLINVGLVNNHRDVGWKIIPWNRRRRRDANLPPSNIVVQELDLPVETVLSDVDSTTPILEVVEKLIDTTDNAVNILYESIEDNQELAL